MEKFLYIYFFGYLQLKWRRLFRVISVILILIFLLSACNKIIKNVFYDNNYAITDMLLEFFLPPTVVFLISYVVKPFVNEKPFISENDKQNQEEQNDRVQVFRFNNKTIEVISKTIVILVISFFALLLGVMSGQLKSYLVDIPFFVGFTLGPIFVSLPIYMFKGRKNFWKKFYVVSLYWWTIYIIISLLLIAFK